MKDYANTQAARLAELMSEEHNKQLHQVKSLAYLAQKRSETAMKIAKIALALGASAALMPFLSMIILRML